MSEKEKIKIEETLEVASEIKTLVGEMFSKINSYDAVAVRTALEAVLEAVLEVLPVAGKRYRSVEVVGVIVQIEDEGVLFERSYYTAEKYKDITLVSKEEK